MVFQPFSVAKHGLYMGISIYIYVSIIYLYGDIFIWGYIYIYDISVFLHVGWFKAAWSPVVDRPFEPIQLD
jgi:hypothetical protein